ncbi:unnamed protein product [Danaus chrysippus]|uniref:(African queen) hypothetical protein n=1 Tax=Danaus chrysippus TaxID=151541 RepID=A0A8J2QKX2_9NEOP|nr:unnamed protein product [Danaus chrysippus]
MELDSIHMDSPKSIADKEQVINDSKDKTEGDSPATGDDSQTVQTENNEITKNSNDSEKITKDVSSERNSPAKSCS